MSTTIIKETEVNGLQVSQLFKSETTETLLIVLEKGKVFPTHTSPKHAFLVVLEGFINFHSESTMVALERHEIYSFKKNIEHYVTANENSKFLIIR